MLGLYPLSASALTDDGTGTNELGAESINTGFPTLGFPEYASPFEVNGIVTGAVEIGSPNIAIGTTILADSISTGAPSVGTSSVAQTHVISTNSILTGVPSVPTVTGGSPYNLTAIPIYLGTPIVPTLDLQYTALLSTSDIVIQPVIGTPEFFNKDPDGYNTNRTALIPEARSRVAYAA